MKASLPTSPLERPLDIDMSLYEAQDEKRYQVLVSSYGDNRQNVKVIGKTEIGF